jgi:hypothetical protein
MSVIFTHNLTLAYTQSSDLREQVQFRLTFLQTQRKRDKYLDTERY